MRRRDIHMAAPISKRSFDRRERRRVIGRHGHVAGEGRMHGTGTDLAGERPPPIGIGPDALLTPVGRRRDAMTFRLVSQQQASL